LLFHYDEGSPNHKQQHNQADLKRDANANFLPYYVHHAHIASLPL
jgi:hypothetical protein